jgi:hypothetical protein
MCQAKKYTIFKKGTSFNNELAKVEWSKNISLSPWETGNVGEMDSSFITKLSNMEI